MIYFHIPTTCCKIWLKTVNVFIASTELLIRVLFVMQTITIYASGLGRMIRCRKKPFCSLTLGALTCMYQLIEIRNDFYTLTHYFHKTDLQVAIVHLSFVHDDWSGAHYHEPMLNLYTSWWLWICGNRKRTCENSPDKEELQLVWRCSLCLEPYIIILGAEWIGTIRLTMYNVEISWHRTDTSVNLNQILKERWAVAADMRWKIQQSLRMAMGEFNDRQNTCGQTSPLQRGLTREVRQTKPLINITF